MKKKILLISGDPNSINSELIFKSWKKINNSIKKKIYLISNFELMKTQLKKLNYPLKLVKVENINEEIKGNSLKVININLDFKNPFKIGKLKRSRFVAKCLNYAHQLASEKEIKGIINCAIDKNLLGEGKIGVTEYLASKCKVKNNKEVMLFKSKKSSVIPITTHIDIKQVAKKLNIASIVNKVKTAEEWFKKYLSRKPKIGILGLNPHNAELRKNSEERRIIVPAIKKLINSKINIKGPLVSDTIFVNDYKNYDVIVGMYHDQVLAPFKTIFKFNAINITLGLKYLRVSPDHGTATSLIGKNKANAQSLLECIYFLDKVGK